VKIVVVLLSALIVLAGVESHNSTAANFGDFRGHPAVMFTRENLHFGFDAILQMAVHLESSQQGS